MQDPPDLRELLESVRRFLEEEVVPAVADPRLRFRSRVAANVLAVAARESLLEPGLLEAERRRLERLLGVSSPGCEVNAPAPGESALRERVRHLQGELERRLRAGELEARPGTPLWEHLRLSAKERLQVANPAFLERRRE